ncbi:MAG: ABC transporter permease [Anaerovoracaceae bacterium]|jgi:putative spermidine/putrescine transport system permease protein
MKKLRPYLLLSPLLLVGVIFLLGVGNALIQSLGYIPAFDMTEITLKYYKEVFSNPTLIASIKVSLVIAIVSSVLAAIFGVLLCAAIVMNGRVRDRVLQVVKIPILIPHTIVALFAIMFLSQNGLLARILFHMGLITAQDGFPMILYDTNNIGIILAYLWKEIPFVAYFVFALMSSINATLGEAAENLGASSIRSFLHVTLPLCMPAVNKAFLIIFAFSFGAYELPFLLGATLPRALPVQAYVEYVHSDLRHRAYAMAMNGVMLLITLALSGIYYAISRKAERMNNGGQQHG